MTLDFVALVVLLGGAIGIRNVIEPTHNIEEFHAITDLFGFTNSISEITSLVYNAILMYH